jgi:recombination protein RecA
LRKNPALEEILVKERKKYGADVLIRGSDLANLSWTRVTSGSLAFDLMMGGGWPVNCWNEIIGNESNGKTVMVLKTIAANMAANPDYECLWVASEDFVPDWAQALGVDLGRVVIANTNVMEEAYQIVIDTLDAQAVDAIVIDSLPALVPTEEDDKQMEEFSTGLGARLTAKFMRKSNKASRRSLVDSEERDCLGIIVNQWREKIGVLYGDPRTTPGGKAKNFSFVTRIEVARDEWIEDSKVKYGLAIKARAIKNKSFPPQRVGVVDFYFDDYDPFQKGDYDSAKEVVAIAMARDIIVQRSSMYDYEGRTWKGKDTVLDVMRNDPVLYKSLVNDVMATIRVSPPVSTDE